MATKSTTAGKKVAAKKSAVSRAKTAGAAARMAKEEAKQVTSATDWKSKSQGFPLEVPSGNVALVRPVGMQAFLTKGMVPNSLRDIAMQAISGKKTEMKMDDMSPEKIEDMMVLFDSVTCYCVIEPKVTPVPLDDQGDSIPLGQRDGDLLYVDEVELNDKIFIFQFACGGTRNLEQFREELGVSMDALSGVQNVENNT